MPSVTRDKKKYGAPTVYGQTTHNEKRRQREREKIRGEEMERDNALRGVGNDYYYTGRVRPLIEDE